MPERACFLKSEKISSGETINFFKIENRGGAAVTVCEKGASLISLTVPDKHGKQTDVLLNFKNIDEFDTSNACFGVTVGRCCGRIKCGKFTLNGKQYSLTVNNNKNHLHGGTVGFARKKWNGKVIGNSVVFTLFSPDNEEGYPGNLDVSVKYTFDDDNTLTVEHSAMCDKDTVFNITGHPYFNLNGHGSGEIYDHYIKINADSYIPIDEELLPIGGTKKVSGTLYDFTSLRKIGPPLKQKIALGDKAKGFDHDFTVNKKEDELALCAVAESRESGIRLECYSTRPILHLYAANYVDEKNGKGGASYGNYSGICFETQGYPDAVNHPEFPQNILYKNDIYSHITKYAFSVIKGE